MRHPDEPALLIILVSAKYPYQVNGGTQIMGRVLSDPLQLVDRHMVGLETNRGETVGSGPLNRRLEHRRSCRDHGEIRTLMFSLGEVAGISA